MNFADAIALHRQGLLGTQELRWLIERALRAQGYARPSPQAATPAPTLTPEKTEPVAKVETPSTKPNSLKDAERFEEAKRSWTKESSRKRSLTHTGTYPEERQAPWPGDVRVVRKRFLVTDPAASELSLPVTMEAGQRFVVVALRNDGKRTIELRRPGSDLTLSCRYSAVYTHSVVTK